MELLLKGFIHTLSFLTRDYHNLFSFANLQEKSVCYNIKAMKKLLFLIFFICISILEILLIPYTKAHNTSCDINNVQNVCKNGYGSECRNLISQCASSINQALQDSLNATAPLQSKLDSLNTQIQGIKDTVTKSKTIWP